MSKAPSDLTGLRFGMLVALSDAGPGNGGCRNWLCQCDCGNRKPVNRHSLIRGNTRSCGCMKKGPPRTLPRAKSESLPFPEHLCCIKGCDEEASGHNFCRRHYQAWRNHGHPLARMRRRGRNGPQTAKSSTKEYRAWCGMKERCSRPESRAYPIYGGRGITVCERWTDSFEAFLSDLGRAPSRLHTLERVDVNGNYEPSNVRWATVTEQNRNTRSVRLNIELVSAAKRKFESGVAVAQIAREMRINKSTIWQAIHGKTWKEIQPVSVS